MTKSVSNKQQIAKLVQLMKCNPDMAKGMYTKNHAKERWESFANILNSLGPPVKSHERWAKVWVDLKSKTKKKIIKIHREFRTENESQTAINSLSPLDLAIDQILDFSGSIDPFEDEKQCNINEENDEDSLSITHIKDEGGIVNEATSPSTEDVATLHFSDKHKKTSFENAKSRRLILIEAHNKEEEKFHLDICNKLDSIEAAIHMVRHQQKEYYKIMQSIEKEKLRLMKENSERTEKYRYEKLQVLKKSLKK